MGKGVYAFIHKDSKKLYIGSSCQLSTRVMDHLQGKNSNIHLQRAFVKYGLINFTLYILELLPNNLSMSSVEYTMVLVPVEQKYLFKDKYNINPTAGKSRFGAKHTEATKELYSVMKTLNPHRVGKVHREEYIEEMRRRMLGSSNPMYGIPTTENNKKLFSKLYSKPIYLYDAKTLEKIYEFNKHADLVKELRISTKTVVKYIDSGMVFRDKYLISSKVLEAKC